MGLPNDFQQRAAACLASGDRATAADLAGVLAAAIAKGEAWGFDGDLAALRKLAGTDELGKTIVYNINDYSLAKAAPAPALPPHLQSRFDNALMKAEGAETDRERELAKAECEHLSGDIKALDAIKRSHARPQRMGLQR